MKTITIIAIAAILSSTGCKEPLKRTNADYVREHHCTTDGVLRSTQDDTVVIDGEEDHIEGGGKPFYYYICPNGVDVMIDYDQDHPFTNGKSR